MKRANFNPFRGGKILGKKQYLLADIIAHAAETFIDELLGEETDRIVLKEQADSTAEAFFDKRTENRTASAESAVSEAKTFVVLLHKWRFYKDGFSRACHQVHISKRTAENLMALLRFAEMNPRAFKQLARLGRTKLYHIAHLPEETILQLKLRKLKAMTDRELLEYLRKIAPVRKRKRIPGLRRRLLEALEIVENERLMLGLGRDEVALTMKKTQELFGKLKKVRDKAA